MMDTNNSKTKRVIIIRHAKSSHDDPTLRDKDRPLNDRGHSDAEIMAKRLDDNIDYTIDKWCVSSSKRTLETFEYFKRQFQVDAEDFIFNDSLYLASEEDLEEYISALDNHLNEIAIICHNPGVSEFVDRYSADFIGNVPTCGIAEIAASCELWNDFFLSNPKVQMFMKPEDFR